MTFRQHCVVAILFILGLLCTMCVFSLSDNLSESQWYAGYFGFGLVASLCFWLMTKAHNKYTNKTNN